MALGRLTVVVPAVCHHWSYLNLSVYTNLLGSGVADLSDVEDKLEHNSSSISLQLCN